MRTFPSGNTATAIAKRAKGLRQLFWCQPKDRSTLVLQSQGFWTGTGNVTTNVIDAYTRVSTSRTFAGLGSMAGLDEIRLAAGIQVRDITISLSQIDDAVAQAIRGYDMRLAPAQFYFGYIDLDTGLFVDPPEPLLAGFISKAPIKTPAAGGLGEISVTITSQAVELTKPNPAKRAHTSQLLRDATDDFYEYVGQVEAWRIPWGVSYGQVTNEKQQAGKNPPKR